MTKNSGNFLFFRRKLFTAMVIVGVWILTGALTSVYEYLFLSNFPGVTATPEMEDYNFTNSMVAAIVWAILGGSIFSFVELFYLQDKLQNKRFVEVVGLKMVVYFVMLVVINLFSSAVYNSINHSLPIWDRVVIQKVYAFATGISFWHPLLPFILILMVTLFLIQINYKFGQGELWKYIRGKYFHPREEERIFLFLDISSSTTIAEKLGNIHFFNFINEFYRDITTSILASRGEIVDYVGDEIIVSWDVSSGLFESRCIQCVLDINEQIHSFSDKYEHKYGYIPEFRAGLHLGSATVGEIGKIKKDITYYGDVMNTTSRIQGLCKEKNQRLMVSENLFQRLPLNNFKFISFGDVQLRGKSENTKVLGVVLEF